MTDDSKIPRLYDRRSSSLPPPIPEEPESSSGIAALVTSNPLVNPDSASVPLTPTNTTPRPRRRSSVSILQALVHSSHLLPTRDARQRNFLVGSSRPLPENVNNDISSSFPNGRALTITMVTWNTGEASKLHEQNFTPTARDTAQPKEQMLNDMCDILLPTCIDYVSDLIIVCTQEMSVTKKKIDWEILLQEVIGPSHVLFHSVHFGTLSLCIYLRRDLIWFCTEPEEDIIKFRAMGPVRTKGSLVVTFNLFGTSFMLINSHFEAGDSSSDKANRQLNFQNTTTKLTIPHDYVQRNVLGNSHLTNGDKVESLKHSESASSLDSALQTGKDITKSCDFVLWAGDMNFRINMSHQEAVEHCNKLNYTELLVKDEFKDSRKKSVTLYADFKEADINFPPTYKFDLRTGNTYVKHRTPSYTDRILYRDKPTSPIECTYYKSVESVKHSDHKPVVAHFRVKLKPGLHTGNLSYGKFNHEVYKRGCEQRERHHTFGVGLKSMGPRRTPGSQSSVCVLQ